MDAMTPIPILFARIATFLMGAWVGICEATAQGNDSCEQATPLVYFDCETMGQPYPQTITRCYQFNTGGSAMPFHFP